MAGSTGLEPATSGLTVQCANQAAPRARFRNQLLSERDFTITPPRCARKCAREFLDRRLEVRVAHDRVAPIHALGLVAGEFHRHRYGTRRRVRGFAPPWVAMPGSQDWPRKKNEGSVLRMHRVSCSTSTSARRPTSRLSVAIEDSPSVLRSLPFRPALVHGVEPYAFDSSTPCPVNGLASSASIDRHRSSRKLAPQHPCTLSASRRGPGEQAERSDHRSSSQSHYRVPSTARARFTLTRS